MSSELLMLLVVYALITVVNLVLTIINVFNILNTNKRNYDLINEMIDVEMNELSEELKDYFRGDY